MNRRNLTFLNNWITLLGGTQHTLRKAEIRNRNYCGFFTSIFCNGRVACNHKTPARGKLQARLFASVEVPDRPLLNTKGIYKTKSIGDVKMSKSTTTPIQRQANQIEIHFCQVQALIQALLYCVNNNFLDAETLSGGLWLADDQLRNMEASWNEYRYATKGEIA